MHRTRHLSVWSCAGVDHRQRRDGRTRTLIRTTTEPRQHPSFAPLASIFFNSLPNKSYNDLYNISTCCGALVVGLRFDMDLRHGTTCCVVCCGLSICSGFVAGLQLVVTHNESRADRRNGVWVSGDNERPTLMETPTELCAERHVTQS